MVSWKEIEKFDRYIHMSQSHVWQNNEKVDCVDQDLIHREQIEDLLKSGENESLQ